MKLHPSIISLLIVASLVAGCVSPAPRSSPVSAFTGAFSKANVVSITSTYSNHTFVTKCHVVKPDLSPNEQPAGVLFFLCGFPGSPLDGWLLAREMAQSNYMVVLVAPPGHFGKARNWKFTFEEYAQMVRDVLKHPAWQGGSRAVIAHSVGSHELFEALVVAGQKGESVNLDAIVMINPWLPRISNYPIPWTKEDYDVMGYWTILIATFGPRDREKAFGLLFAPNADVASFKAAHVRKFWRWPFRWYYARLLKQTAITQKKVLDAEDNYLATTNQLKAFRQAASNTAFRIISSPVTTNTNCMDQIISGRYKRDLKMQLQAKLPEMVRAPDEICGGHMLQAEKPKEVGQRIGEFLQEVAQDKKRPR
jgi:pimeloyl-ACP methyl ester carboxylesterase